MAVIKFVYFDVGGVLIRDFSNTDQWMRLKRDLGVTESTEAEFDAVWQKYRAQICVGKDVDLVADELAQAAGLSLPPHYSMLQDFVQRFARNESIWPVVALARQKYRIGLLTNLYPRMWQAIVSAKLTPAVDWDVIVDSSAVACQKPDERIFAIAEQQAGCRPEEIFFTDNLAANVNAAANRGWQTMLYDDTDYVLASEELLKRLS
jgi:HAD superfamily hydrolase (TIGR01509 family)